LPAASPDPIDVFLKIAQLIEFGSKIYQWGSKRFQWRKISKQSRDIAFAFHSYSWHNFQQSAPIINIIGSIERPEIIKIREIWESSDIALLLKGDAGTGKSGIVLRLAQTFANDDGIPVLFIRATDLPKNQDPAVVIRERLALSMPLGEAFAKLSKERACLLIVDQLDSVSGTDLCKGLVSLLGAISGIPNIKIIAVSRSFEAIHDSDISSLNFSVIDSGHLTTDQTIAYLSVLGITQPSEKIIELASNLLNLSLIADLIPISPNKAKNILYEVGLWEQYFTSIMKREGEEIAAFALKLSREMTAKGDHSFSAPFPRRGAWRVLISRGVLTESPGKRLAFRHEQLRDFLCAYALLPERPTLAQLCREFGNKMPRSVISWLQTLYHFERLDEEPSFIDDVLRAKEQLPFYTRVGILDNLRSQSDPTDVAAKVLAIHLSEWAYNRYFFDGLDKPDWIVPLYRAGVFHNPPAPVEVQPGSFQIPPWPAGEYLAKFAKDHESIIVDIIQSTTTENWRVQEILIDALIAISPQNASDLIHYIDPWLSGRFSDMLPPKLSKLADHLIETGFPQASLQVTESVITPILIESTSGVSKYPSELRFRSDHYWVNEYCERQLPKLTRIIPAGIVTAFARQIERAIELIKETKGEDAELWVGQYWRIDIPNRFSERGDADPLDILIDGLRDGLAGLCKQSPEEGNQFLTAYLSSDHLIFQRIALYTLRICGQSYPALVEKALLQRDYFENGKCATEYQGLLRDQFATVSDTVRTQVISRILAGPLDVDSRAQRRAQRENRAVIDEDRQEIRQMWILYHLEIVCDHLSGEILDRLNELVLRHGKPDIDERPHIVTTSWGGAPSPIPVDELAKKTFDDLRKLFQNYIPNDLFLNTRESLAVAFQTVVRDNPDKYSDFALHLIDPGIRFVYVYHFLFGIREGLKKSRGRLSEAIISLCEYIVTQNEDTFTESSSQYEPRLSTAQLEVARLFEDSLQSDEPYLSKEQLDRIRALLFILANHSDPEKEDNDSGFNPFTRSLNCVRGVAMHAIMHYSLYINRQQEKAENGRPHKGYLEPEIQAILEQKLNKSRDPSLAVHSVFGAFTPQLHYLDRNWLKQHLDAIYPETEDQFVFWKAAWDAYIFTSNVYGEVFKLLIPQYQRGLKLLGLPKEEEKHIGGSPNERLAQHIMFAYLAGMTDFNHDNNLLDLFFDNASDSIRATGVFWLSKVLEEQKPILNDELWQKLWALWKKRIQMAEEHDPWQNSQEISDYMRWLENCPVGMENLFPILRLSVKYFNDGFVIQQLIAYAAKYCVNFPFEAVSLLQDTILSAKEPWWKPKDEDEETILRAAMASNVPDAKRIALEVINFRGERGDFRWKRLIE